MARCYFKIVLVIGFRRASGSERQAHIREHRGKQTSLPGCRPNDIAHILPPSHRPNQVSGCDLRGGIHQRSSCLSCGRKEDVPGIKQTFAEQTGRQHGAMWRGHGRGSDVTVQALFHGHGHWRWASARKPLRNWEAGISVLTCFQGLSGWKGPYKDDLVQLLPLRDASVLLATSSPEDSQVHAWTFF